MKLLTLTLLFYGLLLSLCACNKEKISPSSSWDTQTLLMPDSTYGDYKLVNMIYVDSNGNETGNPVSTMGVTITPTEIQLYQQGIQVEMYTYTTSAIKPDTNLYTIPSLYGPPCNNYSIVHDTLNMYYITIPTNNVGCYRTLKSIKL